jgi:hypothetical protein
MMGIVYGHMKTGDSLEYIYIYIQFGPEPSASSSAVEKRKNYSIKDYNSSRGSVWL